MFVHHAPGLEGVPLPFQGILNVRTACEPAPQCLPRAPAIAAVGLRGTYNERGNIIFTTTGPLVENAGAPGQLVFPHIAEGGGYTTQFIVIGAPSGPGSSGTLRFFNQEGNPLSVTLAER